MTVPRPHLDVQTPDEASTNTPTSEILRLRDWPCRWTCASLAAALFLFLSASPSLADGPGPEQPPTKGAAAQSSPSAVSKTNLLKLLRGSPEGSAARQLKENTKRYSTATDLVATHSERFAQEARSSGLTVLGDASIEPKTDGPSTVSFTAHSLSVEISGLFYHQRDLAFVERQDLGLMVLATSDITLERYEDDIRVVHNARLDSATGCSATAQRPAVRSWIARLARQ